MMEEVTLCATVTQDEKIFKLWIIQRDRAIQKVPFWSWIMFYILVCFLVFIPSVLNTSDLVNSLCAVGYMWLQLIITSVCERKRVLQYSSSNLHWQLFCLLSPFSAFQQCSELSLIQDLPKNLWQRSPAWRFMWFTTSVRTIKTFFAKSCLFQTARLWYATSVIIMALTVDCGWSEAWDCSYVKVQYYYIVIYM